MRKVILIVNGLLLLMAFAGCERVIEVDIKPNSTKLVIEGNITNIVGAQTINISKTVAYSDDNVYPPVSGAVVTVSNITGTYTFKETQPGQYTNSVIRARPGQEILFKVTLDNRVYTATSTMPQPVVLDSLGVTEFALSNKYLKTVSVYYQDPVDKTNSYRFIMSVNGVLIKQVFTINDELTNGRPVNSLLYQTDIALKSGDRVDVEMQCIDPFVYNYWYSLSKQGGNGPNNSATPSNPISNLTGDVLGYFSAHTVQKKSIVIL